MIKQILNSVIAKYGDLSVSHRSIICVTLRLREIIDLLTTDKSRYFAQPRPIINNYFFKHFGPGEGYHIEGTGVFWALRRLKTFASSTLNSFRFVFQSVHVSGTSVGNLYQDYALRGTSPLNIHMKNKYRNVGC